MKNVKPLCGLLTIGLACLTTGARDGRAGAQATKTADAKPAVHTSEQKPASAADNPTSRDSRGEPSLEDWFRPAAWIHIDGKAGRFKVKDGKFLAWWTIDEPVSELPTFRVEAYEPLLGKPTNFVSILDRVDEGADPKIAYAIKAEDKSFRTGKTYSLANLGKTFTVRNRVTGDVVLNIAPLPPGTYQLTAGIKNPDTGKEGLAITQFIVAASRAGK